MSAVPITFVGILAHGDGSSENVTFTGMGSITGLQVGGGPMPGGKPPQIWGGGGVGDYIDAGLPIHQPGGPIGIWGGGSIGDYIDAGFPIPQPPFPGPPPDGVKPPPPEGGWGYSPDYGWGYFPPTGGKPSPPKKK